MGLKKKMAAKVARKLAEGTPKEAFLRQLGEACVLVLRQREGSVNIGVEIAGMKQRMRESGLDEVFRSAGITDDDIEKLVLEAAEKAGLEIK